MIKYDYYLGWPTLTTDPNLIQTAFAYCNTSSCDPLESFSAGRDM
jgi:hypothetical protein